MTMAAGLPTASRRCFILRAGANSRSEVVRLFGLLPHREVDAEAFIPYLKKGLDKRAIKRDFKKQPLAKTIPPSQQNSAPYSASHQ
jgi:hypothetical protein